MGMWALVCVPGGMCGSQRALGGLALYFHHVGPGLAAGPSLHLSLSPTISLGTNCEQDFVSEFFLLASFLDFAIFFSKIQKNLVRKCFTIMVTIHFSSLRAISYWPGTQ